MADSETMRKGWARGGAEVAERKPEVSNPIDRAPSPPRAHLPAPKGRVGSRCFDCLRDAGSEQLGDLHEGLVELPPRDIKSWKRIGEVKKIYYRREGRHRGLFKHEFGKRRLWAFFKRGEATLYKLGGAYRLEMGRGCIWDSRGIVFP